MISTQWFLKMQAHGRRRARGGALRARPSIIPAEWTKTYDHFLENIQDWCVSRQLWWGHRIPAWHGAERRDRASRASARRVHGGEGWTQDPDVLDTWFSSALWPFSTLGWPDETPALAEVLPAPTAIWRRATTSSSSGSPA